MATTSQHRCVFVGNIPYDATEEQLIRICEEVGPVVSFRLVIDRETGKPKGYGFCEYKDEETAKSARRNLQGYEINGRQLRVDFAENDKNMDKSREQGHGGPGMTTNIGSDTQKQLGAQAVRPSPGLQQPIGLPVAMAAANVMAGVLGGNQIATKPTQNSLENQPGFGSDPLSMHLSKMSRNQLIDIISELKVLATENKEQARQLLLATPLLPKAIFQAQLMLGVVTPQMLQTPNIRQASFSSGQGQQSGVQNLPSFSLMQNNLHSNLMLKSQEGELPAGHPNPLVQNNYTLPSTQPQVQLPILSQSKYQQQGPAPVLPGASKVLPVHSQNMMNMSVRPQIQVAASPYAKQQGQPYMFQHQSQAAAAKLGHNSLSVLPQGIREPFTTSSLNVGALPNYTSTEYDRPPQLHNNPDRDTYQRFPRGSSEKANMIQDVQDTVNHPSKLLKMNDGRPTSISADVNMSPSVSGPSQVPGMYISHPKTEEASTSDKQTSQLPPDMESALLQQVLSLTPEQLSSLPPDQQQQVIQLQQMLRLS